MMLAGNYAIHYERQLTVKWILNSLSLNRQIRPGNVSSPLGHPIYFQWNLKDNFSLHTLCWFGKCYGVIKLNAPEGFNSNRAMFSESNWASSHFYLNMVMFYDYFMNIFYGFLLGIARESFECCLSTLTSLFESTQLFARKVFNTRAHKSGLFQQTSPLTRALGGVEDLLERSSHFRIHKSSPNYDFRLLFATQP